MDISAEIAAIQAASQGSELRQPLVGALNKLNSGSLPAVTVSDVGKILKVGANGWEVGEKSGYMPVPTETKQITENGTHDVTNYASAVVNVSGGGSGGTNSIIISHNNPTIADGDINDLWVKYSAAGSSDLISQTLTRKYKIVITAAARKTNYGFTYYGARELEFIFDDGNGNDVLLQDVDSNFNYSGSLSKTFLFDKNLSNYSEASGLPATMVVSLTVPSGYALKGFRVGWRNDSWGDFWRTFTLTETFVVNGVEYERTVLKKENTTIDDWDVGEYVDFTNDMNFDNFIVADVKQYMKLSTGWTEIESLIDYIKHILQ